MLQVFYQSVVASAIFYAVVCWGSSIRASDTKKLNKLIRKAGSVLGAPLEPLEQVVERRMLHKLLSITDNSSHPLHSLLIKQRSSFSQRLLTISVQYLLRCCRGQQDGAALPAQLHSHNKRRKRKNDSSGSSTALRDNNRDRVQASGCSYLTCNMSDLLRYIDYDHKATFLKMLNQQRMEGEHCDVVVVVENIEFRAHRCVLAACSNYFKKLFKKQSDEDNSIVELDFIRSDIFEEVLNYMYTARLAVRKKDINMMMSSGQILGINFLDNLCTQKRELTNMKTRENQAPGDNGMRAQDAILKELAMEEVRKNSFYDQGMDGMGPGGSHVSQPHNYNTNMGKEPHSHGWGSSSSSDMKLEYLLYGHRDHGSCQNTGAKPMDHNAKKERLLTANRPYGCEHCPKAFTTAAHLKEHLKIHSGFKPHRCVVCGKAFIRGPDLKRHERVHSNERPFACQMCEKAFKHKSHLKDHERQHRGERPFNCGSCDKAFIKASDLKRHWNTMHSGNPRRQMSLSPAASQHGQGETIDQRDWKIETGPHSHNSGDC